MTQIAHTPISEEVLKAAEEITLADLLESPSFSPWLVSAIGNAIRLYTWIDGTDALQDKKLRFEMFEIFNSIPNEDRRACFQAVKTLVHQRTSSSLLGSSPHCGIVLLRRCSTPATPSTSSEKTDYGSARWCWSQHCDRCNRLQPRQCQGV